MNFIPQKSKNGDWVELRKLGRWGEEWIESFLNKEGIKISVYHKKDPLRIISDYMGLETDDPNFDLIKRVVNLLECKFAINNNNIPYDMAIFKEEWGKIFK